MEATIKLIKKAISAEVTASAFYSLASEVTKHDDTRMVFIELSSMEDDHAQDLVNKFKNAFSADTFDSQAYLDELIKKDEGVDVEKTNLVKNGNMKEVLEFAITMEESARDTYLKLADEVVDPTFKKYCMDLAQEEVEHAKTLSNTLDSIDMDMDDRPGL
ncbi:MAG: ferritin family protein [Magnetococcales bacterium]|nr:ferritin family protein [Magnetococcales bacterium]